ncbi:MAG: ATPase, T2SS/T4P/T4SS family [Pseudomonadota bacterium]
MLQIEITHADGTQRQVKTPDDCVIGKSGQNEIRLNSWRISKEHARLFKTPSGVLLEDMGAFGGVNVNGTRIDTQYGPLREGDIIGIGPFELRLMQTDDETEPENALHPVPDSGTVADRQAGIKSFPATRTATDRVPLTAAQAGTALKSTGNVRKMAGDAKQRALEFEWRKLIHAKLLDTMDLRRHDVHGMSDERLREETEQLIRQILTEEEGSIPPELDCDLLCKLVLDEAIGLGPLEELLEDDSVTEIMVNRFDEIYVERLGKLEKHTLTFTGDRAVMGVIERIVAPLGRRIDESSPMVDARLKDGSRVNAIIPPLALKGPCVTIRKFAKYKLSSQDLVDFGALSPAMAEFLKICVIARKNIIVSGGTGSGKTTLLNILSNFIPPGERVITVEDAAELKLHHEHLISLESRPANIEGKGSVPIRELVKNTLRMRPDRIVVGECRGAEALDMLQAMNTGHEGSLTTLHANSPRDGLARLETMVLMAGMELPLTAIREQISSAVDIVVQQSRFACGARKITSIVEITGMESGKIQIQELFKYVSQGYTGTDGRVAGHFTGCDLMPDFYETLRATGNDLDISIFKPVDASGNDVNRPEEEAR